MTRGFRLENGVAIGLALREFAGAIDVVVTTPEDFAWREDVVGTIERPLAREGKVFSARV